MIPKNDDDAGFKAMFLVVWGGVLLVNLALLGVIIWGIIELVSWVTSR